jgi:hypothetical protein
MAFVHCWPMRRCHTTGNALICLKRWEARNPPALRRKGLRIGSRYINPNDREATPQAVDSFFKAYELSVKLIQAVVFHRYCPY